MLTNQLLTCTLDLTPDQERENIEAEKRLIEDANVVILKQQGDLVADRALVEKQKAEFCKQKKVLVEEGRKMEKERSEFLVEKQLLEKLKIDVDEERRTMLEDQGKWEERLQICAGLLCTLCSFFFACHFFI